MFKALICAAALTAATAANAAVTINFNTPSGLRGTSQGYSSGGYAVTAYGYSSFNFGTNSGTAATLYDKNAGGDENGVGLSGDPTHDNEIWYAGNNFQTIPTVILDVSSLLSTTSMGQFLMGSTTSNEQWILAGYNPTTMLWTTNILNGLSEGSWTNLPSWGTYSKYAFYSGGTVTIQNNQVTSRSGGNVLLSALSFSAVPEPGTWALMLLGFGAIGIATRRRRRAAVALVA